MLDFENVTFSWSKEKAPLIKDLSFHVTPGAFVALIGVSGCGKSTIFKLINRLIQPASGQILIRGEDIGKSRGPAGYMPQKDLLFPWRTIRRNLMLPMEIARVPAKEMEERTSAMLEEIGLADYADKYPHDLSGGMRQRVSFGRTLLTDADLLLLDEPFSALDALTRINMQEWLLKEWSRYHKTVLFITHDVEEAIFMSDQIYLVHDRPIRSLEVIDVPADRPRTRDLLTRPDIVQLKSSLVDRLRKEASL